MPLVWYPVNKEQKDNNLAVTLKLTNAITFTQTERAAVAGAAPGASGQIEPVHTPAATPGAPNTYVDIIVSLVTRTRGPTSANW